jgi:hypothetical protein
MAEFAFLTTPQCSPPGRPYPPARSPRPETLHAAFAWVAPCFAGHMDAALSRAFSLRLACAICGYV